MSNQSLNKAVDEYTIDEVARKGKTTVRNVRAYQEKGILPPPIKRGRVGVYNDTHLARLRIIGQLLTRGYSIANISELFTAREQGHDLNKLIGLDTALTSQWDGELASYHSLNELLSFFEVPPDAAEIGRAVEMGIIDLVKDDLVFVKHPKLVQIAVQLTKDSLSLSRLLDIIQVMRSHFEQAAESMSDVAMDVLFKNRQPQSSEADEGRIMQMIWTLRPLISEALTNEISSAIGSALSKRMTEHVVNEILQPKNAKAPA